MHDIHRSPFRTYRAKPGLRDELNVFQIIIEETDLWVAASCDLSEAMTDYVRFLRGQIKTYATLHPEFLPALTPLEADTHAPEIICRMCQATALFGVGPMAAVAGTIAQLTAEKFQSQSPDLLIENGGDTYLCSTTDRNIGILSIPDQDIRLSVSVKADEFPCSFCASSAKIGHSLSFGNADVVVVRATDASIADAAATPLANMLKKSADLASVLARAQEWEQCGVDGVFAQCEGKIGVWGKMELAAM